VIGSTKLRLSGRACDVRHRSSAFWCVADCRDRAGRRRFTRLRRFLSAL